MQKHGYTMASPVSPIFANLFIEEDVNGALSSFTGTIPSHWFRYADDTCPTKELELFSANLNNTDDYIKFTWKGIKEDSLPSLDCAVKIERFEKETFA